MTNSNSILEKPNIGSEVLVEYSSGNHDVCVYNTIFSNDDAHFIANSIVMDKHVVAWKYID